MIGVVAGSAIGLLWPPIKMALHAGGDVRFSPYPLGLLIVSFAVVATVLLVRLFTRPEAPPAFSLHEEHMVAPKNANSKQTLAVMYADVRSAMLIGTGRWRRLTLDTKERLFVYPLRAFLDAEAADQLRRELRARLRQHPMGDALLEEMDQREASASIAWNTKPHITGVLLGVIAACFAIELWSGKLDHPFGLVRYGANVPVLLTEGQLFRLFTSNFLHANWLHVYMNGIALYALGTLLERLLGPWRFWLIYALAAVGGATASAMSAQAPVSVGASTAIFGLFGALGVLNWRFHSALGAGFRQPVRWWIFTLSLNAALPFFVPQIDIAAHVGGFLTGALAAAALCRTPASIRVPYKTLNATKFAGAGMAALFIAAFGLAVDAFISGNGEDETRVARLFVASPTASPEQLNNVAWDYATDATSSAELLQLAVQAAEDAVMRKPNEHQYLDTLATAYYRTGRLGEAIETQRRALRIHRTSTYVSQLGRFLDARLRANDPPRPRTVSMSGWPRLTVQPMTDMQYGRAREIIMDAGDADLSRGIYFYALVKHGDRLLGVLWVGLKTARTGDLSNFLLLPNIDALFKDWPGDVRLEVAYVDNTTCNCRRENVTNWGYQAMGPSILRLP